MKNLIKLVVILISFSFLTSCTSKSAEKAKVEKIFAKNAHQENLAKNQKLDKKITAEIDSVFEKTASDVRNFVSKHDNWADSYHWVSDKKSDKPYNNIRICGMNWTKNMFIIEKRSTRKNSTDVVGYSVEREVKHGKTIYSLETSFFRNSKEIKSRRKYFVISTSDELVAALKPFYKRLEEAKQDVKKNISRIEQMADKS